MTNSEITSLLCNSILEQYGAALKMLENVINLCPESFWNDKQSGPPFYKIVYHILFFLDIYLSKNKAEEAAFTPKFSLQEDYRTSPENFAGNEAPLTKKEILEYLSSLRVKTRVRIENLTLDELSQKSVFDWHGCSLFSSLLYDLRHIMLHIGALHVRLKLQGVKVENWVSRSSL